MVLLRDASLRELNSVDTQLRHRKQIQTKLFLRRFYNEIYDTFVEASHNLRHVKGQMLELGSGAGFLKDRLPEVITSDVMPFPDVDRVIFADKLPFDDSGLRAIFAMNVLHHLADAEAFFREADRALAPGGQLVLMEPHWSLWGRFVYSFLHYEPFDTSATVWQLPDVGRLATANGALPSIIFDRDRARFERLFPRLEIRGIRYHTVLRYLLSGGVSWPAFAPSFTFPWFTKIDRVLSCAPGLFPMFQTILLEKTP